MKIKTKLHIGAILSIATVILIANVLLYERALDYELTNKSRITEQLVKGVFEMNILIYDYRIYKGQIRDRIRAQWQSKFTSISGLLDILESGSNPNDLQEMGFIGELRDNINKINILFNDMEAINGSKAGEGNDTLSSGMKDRIFSQIMGRSHTVVSLSSQLCNTNYKELDNIHDESDFRILISITTLMLFVIIYSWLINRGISRPIARINMGLENMGKGNLDYKIDNAGDNEISRIATSIERMADKLKEITVSRDILTTEIEERIKIGNRLERLSEATTEGIVVSDKGRIVDVNEQFARMFGYTIQEIRGMSAADLVVPNECDKVRDLILSGYEQPYETTGLRKDATTLYLLICGKMLALEGDYMRITAISDITEFKAREKALIKAKDEWERTFNTIPDLIMLLDCNYKVTKINKAMLMKLGLTLNEIIGKTCYDAIHAQYKPMDGCPYQELLNDGQEHTVEVYDEHLNGYYLITSTPMYNPDGILYGSIHLLRDITALKIVQNELEVKTYTLDRLNKNLEELVKNKVNELRQKEQLLIQQSKMAAMGEMMAAVAHQWKQPLNAIGIIVQDIEDAYRYGEIDEAYIDNTVKSTMTQIKFMSDTINEFRDFFKPSREKETFDLIRITADVLSLLSYQLKLNTINYRINCHIHKRSFSHYSEVVPCDATTVTTYKNYLAHVILNIINNAKDAIIERKQRGLLSKDGMLCVDLHKDDGTLSMDISDNGGGIPDGIIDKIFDSYFTTKEGEKGTGIGLYMSKMIVEDSLGGRLYVKNIGDGAVFTIELQSALEG
ncbi:multi-sensor signal transduction histidine kinase [Candidatus Magnetobacterium bavaricum]|uniref:histidine kinase n=1 Tax=Candidatus Magnetobacterium bavaricum TaxID=29290 RepID=A0A0F3GZT4_9BACT|nr:multi-sensor signal transduction histidine kinase [Candidatus Magnetobacterium bavaricum]